MRRIIFRSILVWIISSTRIIKKEQILLCSLSLLLYIKLTSGKNLKYELGGYVRLQYTRTEWNTEWLKNIGVTTKLNLFSNYLENPQNIDVDWETLITWKIYKFFSISFNAHLLYDDDTKNIVPDELTGENITKGPKVQFKEILGIGFSYNF